MPELDIDLLARAKGKGLKVMYDVLDERVWRVVLPNGKTSVNFTNLTLLLEELPQFMGEAK